MNMNFSLVFFHRYSTDKAVDRIKSEINLGRNGKWLIRNGSMLGTITITYHDISKDRIFHIRLCPSYSNKWNIIRNEEDLGKILTKSSYPFTSMFDTLEFDRKISGLLEYVENTFRMFREDLVIPKDYELMENKMYVALQAFKPQGGSLSEHHRTILDEFKEMVCPIEQDDILSFSDVALLNGQLYNHDSIVDWVSSKGTDPCTRQEASIEDIILLEDFKTLHFYYKLDAWRLGYARLD